MILQRFLLCFVLLVCLSLALALPAVSTAQSFLQPPLMALDYEHDTVSHSFAQSTQSSIPLPVAGPSPLSANFFQNSPKVINSCPPVGCVAGKNVGSDFMVGVLNKLGISASSFAVQALMAWKPYEGTNACWNPMATIWKMSERCDFNSATVQSYQNQEMGMTATANTLALDHYTSIRNMLNGTAFNREAIRLSLSTWGTCSGTGCDSLLNDWQALWNFPPRVPFGSNASLHESFLGTSQLKATVCADNLPGNTVYLTAWRRGDINPPGPERWFYPAPQVAVSQCVTFTDIDEAGDVIQDRPYRIWVSIGAPPDTSWPTHCLISTGRLGICTEAQVPGTDDDPPPTPTPTYTPTATPQPGLVIRGQVRLNSMSGPGVAGINIYRSFASYQGAVVATTDSNGFYQASFQHIPGDEMVTVWAQLADYVFDPAQYYWRHYYGYEDTTLNFVANTPTPTNTPTATNTPTPTPTNTPTVSPTPTRTSTPSNAVVITVSDGSGTPGSTGNHVTISADNQTANTTPIVGAQFVVIYNSTIGITFTSVSPVSRTSGFNTALSQDRTNPTAVRATILLYSVSGQTIPAGTGPILDLQFDVNSAATPGAISPLTFASMLLSDAVGNSTPANYSDTGQWQFTILSPCITGDVNCDGAVNIFDLQRLINMILHTPQPDSTLYPLDQWTRTDLTGEGQWNIFDLQRLINCILGQGE